jgi:GT2 family glycosyltransferase
MPSNPDHDVRVSILAVVVLYKQAPSESRSLCSFIQILEADPELARRFSLLIYDNSPQEQAPQCNAAFPIAYKHDPTNAGLARAYNFALERAEEERREWLLLLDQDTSLTAEFFGELIACAGEFRQRGDIGSIVPKLLSAGRVLSPVAHFLDQVRHQYRRSNHAVGRNVVGIQPGRLVAYNSGATLRVSALRAVGGFPEEFWLDYLDHAVFHSLMVRGYGLYVMRAEVMHESSQATVHTVPVWRQRNLLVAQTLFVKNTGSLTDRFFYRVWLMRYSRNLRLHYPDKRLWKEALLEAVWPGAGSKKPPADL